MKKYSKKTVFIVIVTVLVLSLLISAHAEIAVKALNYIPEFEYTYSGMSAEKAEMIVSSWMIGSSQGYQEIMPANILCIFGHSINTGTITQTYHNCNPTSPKCKEVQSKVEYCGRDGCGYSKVLSELTSGLYCH